MLIIQLELIKTALLKTHKTRLFLYLMLTTSNIINIFIEKNVFKALEAPSIVFEGVYNKVYWLLTLN